jgi:hypothetical protein
MRWAIENGCPLDEVTCSAIATHGRTDILKWVRENQECPWDAKTCLNAAINGQLDILKWAFENGCPLNYEFPLSQNTPNILRSERGKDFIMWSREFDYCWDAATRQSKETEEIGYLFNWAFKNGYPWNQFICSAAAFHGRASA